MLRRIGFTLIELMVVIVIVALLAALLTPMLTARVEAAKWSEGKSGAGTIATALRAYVIEVEELEGRDASTITNVRQFMNPDDLKGKYFDVDDYELADVDYDQNPETSDGYVVKYTITVNRPDGVDWEQFGYKLDHKGNWTSLSGE